MKDPRDHLAAAVGAIFPLDFKLHNYQNQQVLYLEDQPQTLFLEITNRGQKNVVVPGDTEPFELHFRPGTLAEPEQVRAAEPDPSSEDLAGWKVRHLREADGSDLLRFSRPSGKGGDQSYMLAPGENLRLRLEGFHADRRGGSRSTRVQLCYDLRYDRRNPLRGSRLHDLAVLQIDESEM